MASRGPDDRNRDAQGARDRRDNAPPTGAHDEPTAAEEVGEIADPDAEQPVHPDESEPSPPTAAMGSQGPDERPPASSGAAEDRTASPGSAGEYPPGYGRPAEPHAWDAQPSGQSAASAESPAERRDRFGWPMPEGMNADPPDRPSPPGQRQDAPPSTPLGEVSPPPQPYNPYDTSAWRVPPAPEMPPRGPYSGSMPAQQPAPAQSPRGPYSGQFPAAQSPPSQSGSFPATPLDDRRSGAFPTVPETIYQSGAYTAPPDPNAYDPARSGPMPQSPYISGAMPQVQRSGPIAYPADVTSTGSRRVIVAPDAGFGSLVSDRPALAFLLAAAALAGAMIAYIALRYSHFPNQIALHFGAAGPSEPNRIGEKRELWTIPFIVGIVLAANTALAWAVYRYDRFAARLLALGCALVGAVAWVVLLTLLHR